ncbi:alpha-1,4-glucan:maltose-1-phosphate maltosyltransferase [Kushneria sinocarnis]|uniref:Alpha-1,4-glucan:maltose-1-phosphate maltosyltransferase n=1 Tax=Kushneria sinocarnis TaxID=595502 RepID=A0A420WX51_9GAMM|nr:alpha-1,4-glucan--maltose-1-phosphate maltosyltransferase [Kushneria sinocarnis]RKR04306.1 alpha-1,4-glucan:maltose-1-phosphate maltosyltransferase [Kushneria sinocarnis]
MNKSAHYRASRSERADTGVAVGRAREGAGAGMTASLGSAEAPRHAGRDRHSLTEMMHAPRLAIEAVMPSVDDGRFAAKAIVGETVRVTAVILCDGHDTLAARVCWRPVPPGQEAAAGWHTAPMTLVQPAGNDLWEGFITPQTLGRYEFVIEAWRDVFGTWRNELTKKHAAGVPIALELEEGRRLVFDALDRLGNGNGQPLQDGTGEWHEPPALIQLRQVLAQLDHEPATTAERVDTLLSPETQAAMQQAEAFEHLTRSDCHYPLDVDRERAAFASWYELFPRSQTDDARRHGTFADVHARLPMIRDMGFDVLYFPPIHPIGHTHRKGRNNTLTPAPDDPGSPYAIGSEAGGHDAIHPELGGFEEFRALVRAAHEHDLEIALDFAIQCSPDHPWLAEHPGWFAWRPDGTIRYAENPPKKYEDIVNVDFYAEDARPALWEALRDVVQLWVDEGVKIFRVDNPHTKPFPFWEWLIADIRSRDPQVLFFAEAFTRPAIMARLGKVGFSMSYTYFTWRNTKAELTEYFTRLNESPLRECYRPNFFVNTPDINPVFLQSSGRPGFLIRAALATMGSGLWGMYSGFELCEAAPIPGREEYLDAEKYEIRPRDYFAPGNINGEIAQLNWIRRDNPALQRHTGITFLEIDNERILYFARGTPEQGNVVLVAISLDPHAAQEGHFELPLWWFGLADDAELHGEDLMTGHRWSWYGKWQWTRLTPEMPFGIWRVRAPDQGWRGVA